MRCSMSAAPGYVVTLVGSVYAVLEGRMSKARQPAPIVPVILECDRDFYEVTYYGDHQAKEASRLKPRDAVTVECELRGRKWDGQQGTKYFTSLNARNTHVRREGAGETQQQAPQKEGMPF